MRGQGMEKTTRVHEEWGWGGFASTGLGRLKTRPRDESYLKEGSEEHV